MLSECYRRAAFVLFREGWSNQRSRLSQRDVYPLLMGTFSNSVLII